jgi:hypothetical protein
VNVRPEAAAPRFGLGGGRAVEVLAAFISAGTFDEYPVWPSKRAHGFSRWLERPDECRSGAARILGPLPARGFRVAVAWSRSGRRGIDFSWWEMAPSGGSLQGAVPSNLYLLSGLSHAQLRWTYANAQLLVAAATDDFGLSPLGCPGRGSEACALSRDDCGR